MDDLRYIFGEPIDTKVGSIYSCNILKYTKNINKFNMLSVNRNTLLQNYEDMKIRNWIEKNIKDFDVICSNPSYVEIIMDLFSIVFNKRYNKKDISNNQIASNYLEVYNQIQYDINNKKIDIKDLKNIEIMFPYLKKIFILVDNIVINRDNYSYAIKMISRINSIQLKRQYKTKELQNQMDIAKKRKSLGKHQDYEDIITTVMAITGYTPNEMKEMTIYQINSIIARINKIKEYDTNISFICVGAKDIKLEPFGVHIDINENKEKLSQEYHAHTSKIAGMLKGKR